MCQTIAFGEGIDDRTMENMGKYNDDKDVHEVEMTIEELFDGDSDGEFCNAIDKSDETSY